MAAVAVRRLHGRRRLRRLVPAFAIEAAANVRTLGLVELIFSYVVSLKLFREKLSAMELGGMALIALGIVIITLGR